MATTSNLAITNSLPRLLHMANQATLSMLMLSLFAIDTCMLSLLKVISKCLVSKVMLITDNLKLLMLLQLEMGLVQHLDSASGYNYNAAAVGSVPVVPSASLQLYQLLKAAVVLIPYSLTWFGNLV